MESLIKKSDRRLRLVKSQKKRYLYKNIDWTQRLILVIGYRGTGKTTLLLQHLGSSEKRKGIYLSLDDLIFETNRLVPVVEQLYDKGFRLFLIDEVHKYLWWSKDLKQLYDDFPDIQIVGTGSSILDISKGNADLSRRASVYHLYGLSFREYMYFNKNIALPELTLDDIITKHHEIAPDLLDTFEQATDFQKYLRYGYFPFFLEAKNTYYQKLEETINLVMESDISTFEELQYSTTRTMKKLLYVISQSVPFKPNIQKLSQKLEAPRNTILRLLDYLSQADILILLKASTKGQSYLQKPEKIYLQNTNFINLFSPTQANIGNIRETFFFNQLNPGHQVTAPKFGDFLIEGSILFEVGGSNKTSDQISGIPNSYLALDIPSGNGKRIPLWLFGLLY